MKVLILDARTSGRLVFNVWDVRARRGGAAARRLQQRSGSWVNVAAMAGSEAEQVCDVAIV